LGGKEAEIMTRKNRALLIIGVILASISIWQIGNAQKGLEVINLHTTNPPATIITPSDNTATSRPTVLIAHGLAGSEELMRGFALTLAHAGYTTISWNFEGHGSNPNPFVLGSDSTDLLRNAEAALIEADGTGLIDAEHIAILGHSMGSGVALLYGVSHPNTQATIAISPVKQQVSANLPHDLLLMAGSLEPQFVENAQGLLASAGGENADFANGTARKLEVIPNVEHISILFSPTAQSNARSWLNSIFGQQPGAENYTDRRILWFGVGILGFILLSNAILNSLPISSGKKVRSIPVWFKLIDLIGGGIIATLILYLLSLLGVNVSQMLGFLVGGYILIWFAIAGITNLIILRPHISSPSGIGILKGFVGFAALWLGVGLLGNYVWLPWLLIPARFWLWIPGSIILLPWFLSYGEAAKLAKTSGQVGWWLVEVISVLGSLYLALMLNPELGFLMLILPIFPIMLGLNMLIISPKHGAWAYAIPGAMFTSWLVLSAFPLL
jgi:pimeloyl-ACP methyl ester carboxylesterase